MLPSDKDYGVTFIGVKASNKIKRGVENENK